MEKFLEKLFRAPAVTLDKGVDKTIKVIKNVEKKIINKQPFKVAEEYWNTLGPGLTTGAADDDPSGITTYSQAGAQYGFQLLWLALFTFPLMAVVQEMCARIGLVTGEGLAGNIKRHYGKRVLYVSIFLLFAANTFNIAADLGAMAKASQLIDPQIGFAFLIIVFALVSLFLQIFTTYARYAKYLKYLALVLFSYVLSALLVHLNWHEVLLHTVWPSITFSKNQIFLICGILGTTISPYLFFWQASQEVEEDILKGKATVAERKGASPKEVRAMRVDIWSGMFISNLVMFFIIIACAATLYTHGINNIASAEQAALALRPLAGNFAFFLFMIGIIGTGMLTVPILAGSAAYAFAESFGWNQGLYLKLKQAYAFYGVIIVSTIIGLGLNFVHLDPIKTLIYAAVANGLVSPILIILIVKISSSKDIMKEHANKLWTSVIGWITIVLMTVSGIAAIASFLF